MTVLFFVSKEKKIQYFFLVTTIIIAVVQIKNYVVIKVLTNNISQSAYGQYSFAITFAFSFASFILSAISITLFQFVPLFKVKKTENKISDLVISSLFFISIVTILFSAIMTIIAFTTNFIGIYMNSYFVLLLSIGYAFVYALFGLFISLSRIENSKLMYAKFVITYEVGSLAAILITVYLIDVKVESLLTATLIGQIVGVSYFLVRGFFKHKEGKVTKEMLKKTVTIGGPRIITEGSKRIFEVLCGIIIVSLLSDATYALIAVALSLANFIGFIIVNLVLNFIPNMSSVFHETANETQKLNRMNEMMKSTITMYSFFSIPLVLIIATFADFLINLISDSSYLAIAQYVIFFLIYSTIYFFSRIIGVNLVLKEKTGLEAIISFIIICLGITISYLLISNYGLLGIAISFILYAFLHTTTLGIVGLVIYRKTVSKRLLAEVIIVILIVFGVYASVFLTLNTYYALLISISIFFGLSFILKLIPSKEIKYMLSGIKEIFIRKSE